VYIDFEILEGFTVAHESCHVSMIFEFLYASLYYLVSFAGQNTELAGVETESYIQSPGCFTYGRKYTLKMVLYFLTLPPGFPTGFSIAL
jgi:hypothetical protein